MFFYAARQPGLVGLATFASARRSIPLEPLETNALDRYTLP